MDCWLQCLEFRFVLCQVEDNTKRLLRTGLIAGLNVLFAGFPEKISLSIPFPMNYWPNYPQYSINSSSLYPYSSN